MGQAGGPQAAGAPGRSAAAQRADQSRIGRRDADALHHRAAAKSEPVPDRPRPRHQADDSGTLGRAREPKGGSAQAQATRGFKVIGVNHLSYTCPDYTRARDFQINVFGLENAPGHDDGKRANLMFGPEPGKGGTFIVARNAGTPSNRP